MGEVYRAKDLRLGREVALKVLPTDVASHPDRLARFEREARAVARLNHPNIVVLYSVEDVKGVRFLTMELVDGQNLEKQLRSGGMPLPRQIDIGIALADALTAAHEKGVVHRDLKPSNIMVTCEGRVKVLDFGLAKLTIDPDLQNTQALTAASPLSIPGDVMGTVPYMAPEQIRGETVDARSDLFALGIILYELATGTRPFIGANFAEVASAILNDTPKPLTSLRDKLPIDLDRIVSRCLEKHPRERFQTALDVSNELRRLRRVLARGEAEAPPAGQVASIAVLPFVNHSRDKEDEYFSDGLADELLNVLAKIRGLRVAARTSAFHFKGKDTTIAEVGRVLNVATVLEGSVRRAGPRVRISVQLANVSDGYHLWSETYDRTLEDILAVQDDIAQSVVQELRGTLWGVGTDSMADGDVRAEVSKAAKGRATDPEAHRLHLLARYLIDRFTFVDVAKGIAYLKQALELDPKFALASAELAEAYAIEASYAWIPVADGYALAREAAERSLALEPDLAEAHAERGWISLMYEWDWESAAESYARALELAPGHSRVLRRFGVLARIMGRLEEANELHHRAVEQDPLNAPAWHQRGITFHVADRFVEAEDAYRRALELAPQRSATNAHLALALLARGRGDEALAIDLREPLELARLWAQAIVRAATGHAAESDEALRDLAERYTEEAAYQIAEVHATRGTADAAFEWLDRAYALRDSGLVDLKFSPRLRSLHGDPRWSSLLRRLRLPE